MGMARLQDGDDGAPGTTKSGRMRRGRWCRGGCGRDDDVGEVPAVSRMAVSWRAHIGKFLYVSEGGRRAI
jgi:hypothetical protein